MRSLSQLLNLSLDRQRAVRKARCCEIPELLDESASDVQVSVPALSIITWELTK